MNRFRTKKRGKDEDGIPRPSQDSESSMPFRGFRKGKKSQEEEKKPIDLATVLPSDDNFRTSLLMTGLSARFSMLREQDDPNTKIGKASDDSVLFPKRQSRMDLAAFRGLGDIAESESIKATSPFARIESYHSDDADSSQSASIMTRAKPTEGNNLFGGRQKIYKIPASAGSSKAVDGGMSGRALYDDDVAQSAFQKWRRAEKERELSRDRLDESDTLEEQRNSSADLEPPRSESPSLSGYNQKRETSSTLSSIPSIARQSSAATSVTSSQPAASLKDWQPLNTTSAGPERSVTRTRRLYETGFFNQDTQEAGTSNVPRGEASNRQRLFSTRTPELSQQSPSLGSTDRLSGERRLLTKASAPNLRPTSPPANASPTVPNLGIHVPSTGESRSNFAGSPPISPPISEVDENALLSINPNDRGKATALGVFQKPAQPYDETRYAQRQLQLQRGREAPTQKSFDEPNRPTSRSQPSSTSPIQTGLVDSPTVPVFAVTQSPLKDAAQPASIQGDPEGSETSSIVSPLSLPSPQVDVRRPSDKKHPAFRSSALPVPLSLVVKPQSEPPTITEIPSSPPVESKGISPVDSPTLGPGIDGSGLSGMVRQHLRADSNASSIYDGMQSTAALESGVPVGKSSAKPPLEYGTDSNPWEGEDRGRDWNLDLDVNEPILDTESFTSNTSKPAEAKSSLPLEGGDSRDEFVDRLADEARRIREKLTSYVETDSRSPSPHRMVEQKPSADLASLPRPSGLGSILRTKDSKGSLTDRGRDPSSTRAFKMMGISPAGSRTNSPGRVGAGGELGQERDKAALQGTDDQHSGLRAFQQARGELQRIKGLEMQSRYYPPPQGPPPDIPSPRQRTARQPGVSRTRTPSRDRKPAFPYPQRVLGEESRDGDSSPNFHMPSFNDRHRSEPEPSIGARFNSRVTRPGDVLTDRENGRPGPAGPMPRPPIRLPGFPGNDAKRSHTMPQQPYPNDSRMNQISLNTNGRSHASRGYETSQPPPISPGVSPLTKMSPSSGQSPSYDNPIGPVPSSQSAMRYKGNSRGVPEPTRTSNAPLPLDMSNQPRINGRIAPPVPPINPRRRQDGTNVRTGSESFALRGRDRESIERNAPLDGSSNSVERRVTVVTDEENGTSVDMRRPPRAMAGVANMTMNFDRQRGSSPPVRIGPPVSRTSTTQGRNPSGQTELPGGLI
ncbi:hypothetical protein F4861DRAFT_468614 [Xylaria intraflava]|nr:hypothetical protein F4861DRAFT_468614 [Xylaria intraflava]